MHSQTYIAQAQLFNVRNVNNFKRRNTLAKIKTTFALCCDGKFLMAMNSRLGLFRETAKCFSRTKQSSSRKLYTDHIYPYPFNYFNNKVYPSQIAYRETWPNPPWTESYDRIATYLMRAFWSIWWYQLLSDPGVILGHTHLPDPALWTDAELGIPPDNFGSYYDWLAKKEEE